MNDTTSGRATSPNLGRSDVQAVHISQSVHHNRNRSDTLSAQFNVPSTAAFHAILLVTPSWESSAPTVVSSDTSISLVLACCKLSEITDELHHYAHGSLLAVDVP